MRIKRSVIGMILTIAFCISLFGCSDQKTNGEFSRPVALGGHIMENNFGKAYFESARVGLFTHYTYATYAEGKGTECGGSPLEMRRDADGYRITLPDTCDPVDTVVRLTAM